MSLKGIMMPLLACGVAVVVSAAPGAAAQAPQVPPRHAATDKAKPRSDMAAKYRALMAEREQMIAEREQMLAEREQMLTEMKAAGQRLDDLVARMSAASGTEKVAATAAVVAEVLAQRRTMRDGMPKMPQGMMDQLTEHLQAGKDSMAMCPMTRQASDMKR